MRVLLAEDDNMIAQAVAANLKDSGYAVDWVKNGSQVSTDLHSRLNGLDGGADDYIVKPFDMAELQARMRAVLRRHSGHSQTLLTNGALTLNPATYQVEVKGEDKPVLLSNKEFAVLQALMMRPGIILSRSDLEDKIYGWGEEVESNAVDFLIHALRKKLGKEHIQNVRGVGWLVAKEVV